MYVRTLLTEAVREETENEETTAEDTDQRIKISPTLTVPGYGRQYKSHLVTLLNQKPELSHDRLTRVRQNQDSGEAVNSTTANRDKAITLFDDYAYVGDGPGGTLKYGRVLRVRKKGKTRGYVEYKYPVSFNDPNLKDISCVVQQYSPSLDVPSTFHVKNQDVAEVSASNIITHVNFTYDPVKEVVAADNDELSIIEATFQSRRKTNSKKKSSVTAVPEKQSNIDFNIDGVIRSTVVPTEDASGARRSKRTRTVISSMSDFV